MQLSRAHRPLRRLLATRVGLPRAPLVAIGIDQDAPTVAEDCAMAKVWCSEMLGRVADQAIQTCGGMGVMADLPLERIWRDARVERIWEGTSEIQRHIISRQLLRPLGA